MCAEWSTAQIALVVSLLSFVLALASFAWNVWSKFIFPKPKVGVELLVSYLVGISAPQPLVIQLTATNSGPGEVTLVSVFGIVRKGRFWSPATHAALKCLADYPRSFALSSFGEMPNSPVRLGNGESYQIHFNPSVVSEGNLVNFAFKDGFGREHKGNRKSRKQLISLAKEFQ